MFQVMESCTVENCTFCNIIKGVTDTRILYQDDDFIVFPDIRPASKHHYLVVPKKHISDAKSLAQDQVHIVSRAVEIAKKVLGDEGADLDDARFGFHWPPFQSIHHLHLHVISPTSEMGFLGRLIFKPNSWWFVTPDYVENRLKVATVSS